MDEHGIAPGAQLLGGYDRSRLLASRLEAQRLERVLLRLPGLGGEAQVASIADTLAAVACELTGARAGIVTLPELLAEPALAGPDAGWINLKGRIETMPVVAVALRGGPVEVADTALLDPGARDANLLATSDGRPYRSLLAIPVRGGGQTHGALVLAHHRSRAFSPRQSRLTSALADHLGSLIELARVAELQGRVATALQESLLPPLLPSVPGLDIAARYRPSGPGNLVGGDFYDLFRDGKGGWYLLLGDASGIGPEAAGLAGVARYTARALADSAPPPADMLAQINRAILRAASEGRFCTAVLARLHLIESGGARVQLAVSGHPTAYVLRADGETERASADTGLILGIAEDAPVGNAELQLASGDSLVLYTDGVIEARDQHGEEFGDHRLVETLREGLGRSAEGIARRLERAVLDHRSATAKDDVAIVVLRVHPGPSGEPG